MAHIFKINFTQFWPNKKVYLLFWELTEVKFLEERTFINLSVWTFKIYSYFSIKFSKHFKNLISTFWPDYNSFVA